MKQKRSSASKAVRTQPVKRRLSESSKRDCRTFARLYSAKKAATQASADEPTWNFVHLEKLTGISQNNWGEFVREERSIGPKAMTWIEKLYAYPKERFENWPRPGDETAPWIIDAIARLPDGERTALTETLEKLLRAPKNRREKIIQTMRRMLGASGKIAFVKASSA
jgi:hypothetical protein